MRAGIGLQLDIGRQRPRRGGRSARVVRIPGVDPDRHVALGEALRRALNDTSPGFCKDGVSASEVSLPAKQESEGCSG